MANNTTTLTFDVIEQTLKLVTDTSVASGGLNDIVLSFNFTDNTWNGLSLKAVFKSSINDTAYSVPVVSNEAIVPHEVMREKCTVYVGLAGAIVNSQVGVTLVRTTAVYGLKLERGTPIEFKPSVVEERCWASVAEMWATGGLGGIPTQTNNAKFYAETAGTMAEGAISSSENAASSAEIAQSAKNEAITAKNEAITAKNGAQNAKDNAIIARDEANNAKNSALESVSKAYAWAETPENSTVETGKYSAKHYAAKAGASAASALESRNSAISSAESARQSAEQVVNMTVSSEITTGGAEVIKTVGNKVNLHFKIPKGQAGVNARISGATATIDNTSGTPYVSVTMGGTEYSRTFAFAFSGLKADLTAISNAEIDSICI